MQKTYLATLGGAIDIETLFTILAGRGCCGAAGEDADAHALAHLALGHLARADFSESDELDADCLAFEAWFALEVG